MRRCLLRFALAVAVLSMGLPSAQSPACPRPSPAPFERVFVDRYWRTPTGSALAFCVLGHQAEERGRVLAVYDSSGGGWRQLFLDADRGFHPWALELCELDGDTLPEVAVGVYKASRFDPVERNRIFIFDWTDSNVLFAKWLGSRLGGPIEGFAIVSGPDARDRLLCLHPESDGGLRMRRYVWNGFGFDLEGDVAPAEAPSALLSRSRGAAFH
jgi:hypothetical protein